jgi:hypothetical protein
MRRYSLIITMLVHAPFDLHWKYCLHPMDRMDVIVVHICTNRRITRQGCDQTLKRFRLSRINYLRKSITRRAMSILKSKGKESEALPRRLTTADLFRAENTGVSQGRCRGIQWNEVLSNELRTDMVDTINPLTRERPSVNP